jgi:gluconokinase
VTFWVLMGIAGSGKTAVGRAVAAALGIAFVDGDDFHDEAAVRGMRAGVGLDAAARDAWAARLAADLSRRADRDAVVACSALTSGVRRRLVTAAGAPVAFFHLVAPPHVVERRLADRKGHFLDPRLLAEQLATLENAPEAVPVDADAPVEEVTQRVLRAIAAYG